MNYPKLLAMLTSKKISLTPNDIKRGGSHGGVVNVLECDIVVSKFKLQSRFFIPIRTNVFVKGMNSLFTFLPISYILPLLFFYGAFVLNNPRKFQRNQCKEKPFKHLIILPKLL